MIMMVGTRGKEHTTFLVVTFNIAIRAEEAVCSATQRLICPEGRMPESRHATTINPLVQRWAVKGRRLNEKLCVKMREVQLGLTVLCSYIISVMMD